MFGRVDHGLVDIFADPDACFVRVMALPLGSTRALANADDTLD